MAYNKPDKQNYSAGEMQFGNFLVPGVNTDEHGIVHSFYINGGITEMPTIADRNEIPIKTYINGEYVGFTENIDGISSGRRRIGMLVYVLETQKHYQLLPKGYFGNNGDGTLAQFQALPEWERARLLHPESSDVNTDQMSFNPIQGPVAEAYPITGVAADCWVEIDLLNSNPVSSGPTKYLAYVTFTVAEEIESITMVDPNGDNSFSVKNVTTSTSVGGNSEKFAEFTFGNETSAPSSITILASNMQTSEYIITSLNGGGDNKQYVVANATMTQTPNTDKYTSDIFGSFGNATIKLDLTKGNIDYARRGFPTKEAHAYIIFTF